MKYKTKSEIIESNILDGYSLSQISKKTGLHPSYISIIRSGKRKDGRPVVVSYEVFERIQKGLTSSQEVVE
jgi:transcriptional regulator with XRE-family HTH domain